MPVSYLDATVDLLANMCMGWKDSDKWRYYRVTENALPADSKVVSATLIGHGEIIRIGIESSEFIEGARLLPPYLECVESPDVIQRT